MSMPVILAIDDDPRSRGAIENLLAEQGYRLEFGLNGPNGLQRARELLPDLILLDVMMPGMDGFEVCEIIRADPALNQIPVLMLTALDDSESRLQGLTAGADDFISKPFIRQEMLARIKTILQLNRYRRLRAENERLLWILNQASDGYLMLDKKNRITYANQMARTYLEVSSDELPADDFFVIIAQQYHLEPEPAWAQASEDQQARYLVRPETRATPAVWLQFEELPGGAGMLDDRLIHLCDISDKVAAKTDMRKFHGIISHKLRTPLSGIWGGINLLMDFFAKDQLDNAEEILGLVKISVDRLKKEIDDIFEYTFAPVIARQGNHFCFKDLPELLDKKAKELSIAPPRMKMPLTLAAATTPLSDKAMDIILFQLMENSKKFHPSHLPKIEIEVKQADNSDISMLFADDGIQLSPAQLQSALTPYQQCEKKFTGEAEGMGLGLPVASAMIWQAGGKIELRNRTDKAGMEVRLNLPVIH